MAIDRNQAPNRAGEDRSEETILIIQRGQRSELRLIRVIDKGFPSLLLRAWVLDPVTETWIPGRRGISIRRGELSRVAECLIENLPWAAEVWQEHDRQGRL